VGWRPWRLFSSLLTSNRVCTRTSAVSSVNNSDSATPQLIRTLVAVPSAQTPESGVSRLEFSLGQRESSKIPTNPEEIRRVLRRVGSPI
jgi:hypothetical protein